MAEDGAAEGHGSVEKTVQTPAGTRGTPTDPLGEEILNMPGVVRVRPRKRRAEIIQTVDTRSKRTRTRASRGEAEDGDDAVSEISQGITARLYIHDRGVGRRSEATYLEHSNSCLEQIVANNARLVELQRKKDAEAEAKQKKD